MDEQEQRVSRDVTCSETAPEKVSKLQKSLGATALAIGRELWTVLFADPAPQPDLPVFRAVRKVLSSVEKVLWVQCQFPSLEISDASSAAKAELPSPLIGRKAPTLLVSNTAAQTLRRALLGCSQVEPLKLATSGCICQNYGQVAIWSTRGPSLPVVITFLIFPATSGEAEPNLLLLFNRVPRGILRATTHSLQGSDIGPEDSASQIGLNTLRPRSLKSLSWCDELEDRHLM